MNSLTKLVLAAFVPGMVVLGLSFSDWSYRNNDPPKRLNEQDKNSIATIERQEANGRLTSTQATMEKDSTVRHHSLKF